jgi:glycosyltransferase involved in cell wall biosynthesis
MSTPSISVCMISGAEATRIGRALASVADWTTERLVVLNDGVADGTDAVAQRYGAKVFREPWKGHIAQKNSVAGKATGEWLLGLDADEAVSTELKTEVLATVSDPARHRDLAAFSFPRLSWCCGRWIRHGDWYPDRKTRLWRRGQAHWGGVDPHDKLVVNGRSGKLRGDLLHYPGDTIDSLVLKIIPFSDGFVREHAGRGLPGPFGLIARPAWRFVRAYFLRLGFLDGWPGYYLARINAFGALVRYAKLREAQCGRQPPQAPPLRTDAGSDAAQAPDTTRCCGDQTGA